MDLRIEKTYLSLHKAFTNLLEEKRFEDISVGELCENAMIRRTTFYKHFADKYEYFVFYIKEICRFFQNRINSSPDPQNINEYFIQMSKSLLDFMESHRKMIQKQSQSGMYSMLSDVLSAQIAEDICLILQKIHPESECDNLYLGGVASCYSGALLNLVRYSIKQDHELDEETMIRIITDLLVKEPSFSSKGTIQTKKRTDA